jgi:hypothetical protein
MSSVLEGMTGFCFPVASDLCTRFVTQIVLIRAPESDAGVRVTIIPGPTTQMDDEYKAHLLGFERRMAEDDFGSDDLRRIFNEVGSSSEHIVSQLLKRTGCKTHGRPGTRY